MVIDTTTARLLDSALSSPAARDLFKTIANRRIADVNDFPKDYSEADLGALENADLIGKGNASNGTQYFVRAKGLKVARDLEKLRDF